MKNLTKIIGFSLFGVLSSNLNAQYNSFVKEDYDKYCITYALADINGDSINDVVVVDYDLNMNGKKDARAVFIITGRKEEFGKGVLYTTKNKACMLILDIDEDGKDDEVFIDRDLDGIFDYNKNVNSIGKPKALIL